MEDREKKSYIEALVYMSLMDGKLDESEKAFFQGVGEELGIESGVTEAICSEMESSRKPIIEILSNIESYEVKETLVHSLLELCYIDGEYSGPERNGMKMICNILGIDETILKSLEKERQSQENKKSFMKGLEIVKKGLAFTGEKGKQGGKIVASGISHGLGIAGSKLSSAMASAKKLKEENQQLRDELEKTTVTEAVKQKIILQLNSKISALTAELRQERERNNQNEEIIRILQAQLEDLEHTMEVAEATKTA